MIDYPDDDEGTGPDHESGSETEQQRTRKRENAERLAAIEAEWQVWKTMFGEDIALDWADLLRDIRWNSDQPEIDQPWLVRPGCSTGPPNSEEAVADRQNSWRYWAPLVQMYEDSQLFNTHAGATPCDHAPYGPHGPRFASPLFKRPLGVRALVPGASLKAMRVHRLAVEQGGMCRESVLLGARLITARSIRGSQPIFEFWFAPCRRRGFEDHAEIVASFLLGTGYREPIRLDDSDFELASACRTHLRFAVEGPGPDGIGSAPQTGDPGLDWMARQPAFESMFFDGSFPEIWWIAEPGDDTFMPRIPKVGQ